jgi:ribosomal protein S6
MSETAMPATEAASGGLDERNSYEFAFHVLPTVAEGEVAGVFDSIKAQVARRGEITSEEMPERIDLIYPVVKHIEGKNRKFNSAYFGWIRFKLEAEKVGDLMENLGGMPQILRHLLVKLTALEEAHPVRFHENRKSVKMVEVVNEEPGVIDESHAEIEEKVEVSEEALDESLKKITKEQEG